MAGDWGGRRAWGLWRNVRDSRRLHALCKSPPRAAGATAPAAAPPSPAPHPHYITRRTPAAVLDTCFQPIVCYSSHPIPFHPAPPPLAAAPQPASSSHHAVAAAAAAAAAAAMDRHGRPEEELFFQKPSANVDSPTVGPLRITKFPNSSASNTPPPQGTPPPAAAAGPPTYKPPNAPLPYPEDRPRPQPSSSSSTPPGRQRGDSLTAPQPSNSSRTKFSANDPNRPTLSGYAYASLPKTASPAQSAGSSHSNPQADEDDTDGLFQKDPQRRAAAKPAGGEGNPFPTYHQQYWPPPTGAGASSKPGGLNIPAPGGSGIHRLDSTASVSTTRATRGSPPPPETPILPPPSGGIEARYAAAGFGGPVATTGPSAAASQRQAQYAGVSQQRPGASPPAQQQSPPRRPWTPTEQPGSQPHGPPTVYQGPDEIPTPVAEYPPPRAAGAPLGSPPPGNSVTAVPPVRPSEQALEHDFSRMNVHADEPPPAYSTISGGATTAQGFPNEKNRPVNIVAPSPAGPSAQMPHNQGHPAFHNDPRLQPGQTPSPAQGVADISKQQYPNASPAPTAGPASPPPLPEGWIAHLDPNSGQYYYIPLGIASYTMGIPKRPYPAESQRAPFPYGHFCQSSSVACRLNFQTTACFTWLPSSSVGNFQA